MKRRELCAFVAAAAGAAILSPVARLLGSSRAAGISPGATPELAAVKGAGAAATRRAVDLIGGMKRFVRPGQRVVVKPNIGWDRAPEQAANTSRRSGIQEAVERIGDVRSPGTVVAGADIVAVDAYATRFFDKSPRDIAHVVRAAERGLGTMDLTRVAVREESV